MNKNKIFMGLAFYSLISFLVSLLLLDKRINMDIGYQIRMLIYPFLMILLIYFAYKNYKTKKEKYRWYIFIESCSILFFGLPQTFLSSRMNLNTVYKVNAGIIIVLTILFFYFSFKYYKVKKESA